MTRCEIGAPWTTPTPVLPRDLDLVDATFDALDLLSQADGPVLRDARQEIVVGQLLHRLLDVGTLRDASHLWISARGPGQLVVEALFTPASIVDRFVDQALRSLLDPGGYLREKRQEVTDGERLPAVPDQASLAGRPVLTRRTVLLALFGAVRKVLMSKLAREHSRAETRDWLGRLRVLTEEVLASDDPVRAMMLCRIDLTRLDLIRHDEGQDSRELVETLIRSSQHCVGLFEARILDRGAAAEIVSAVNRQLDAVRRAIADRGALPDRPVTVTKVDVAGLDTLIRDQWRAWLRMVETDDEQLAGGDLPDLLAYHLHNYAAFLANHPDSVVDLTAALALFRDVVLPARERFVRRTGLFEPLRTTLQMVTAATTGLADLAAAAGDRAAARTWATFGYDWINRAVAFPGTWAMVDEGTEDACRFALRAAPALLAAMELGVAGVDVPAGLEAVDRLLAGARRWDDSVRGTFIRRHEIETLTIRLGRVRAG
jgi:hypothetical protein